MVDISDDDRRYLSRQISLGQAVLILGAGASLSIFVSNPSSPLGS